MLNTIGYEGASLGDFIRTLELAGVSTLVDIRERAQSRRKGFSKSQLSEQLAEAGINYVHYRELGDPKEGRDAARRGDWRRFRRVFDRVIKSEEAIQALEDLTDLAKRESICLMCYERDFKTCHRAIVSEIISSKLKRKVRHLGVNPIERKAA
ncbi:MAG: DUF488 domain-containing protein [Parvibaculaceae bacterium]|nr:DUF488 domain-containing protein [Kangiella sp.]